MKTSIISIFFLLCLTAVYAQGSNYQDHPLRDANINRPASHWNMNEFHIDTNPMTDYLLSNKVGAGTFGTVYKTTHLPTGQTVAFKHLVDLDDWDMKREVQIMQELADAPNVLPIRDIVRQEDADGKVTAGLILDFFNAESYRRMFLQLTKLQVKHFIYQTLRTLSVAHSRGIVHRDIKPLNVLMNSQTNDIRVIDWGLGEFYQPDTRYTTSTSTLYFKSPELLLEYRYHDYALDIWSTGCMLAEMVFLKDHLFNAGDYPSWGSDLDTYEERKERKMQIHKQHLEEIAQILGTVELRNYVGDFADQMEVSQLDNIPDYPKMPFSTLVDDTNTHLFDSQVEDLLQKMLTYDHTKRITAAEALLHIWFDEVRESTNSELSAEKRATAFRVSNQ